MFQVYYFEFIFKTPDHYSLPDLVTLAAVVFVEVSMVIKHYCVSAYVIVILDLKVGSSLEKQFPTQP